eukprot:1887057-Prymnesium_polylepis.1
MRCARFGAARARAHSTRRRQRPCRWTIRLGSPCSLQYGSADSTPDAARPAGARFRRAARSKVGRGRRECSSRRDKRCGRPGGCIVFCSRVLRQAGDLQQRVVVRSFFTPRPPVVARGSFLRRNAFTVDATGHAGRHGAPSGQTGTYPL